MTDPVTQRRTAGILLIAGPAIYFIAEFIAAAAWTDPPYSYTFHFISNLGVRGPSTLFDQYMYSPLAWVMNTGFFLFGIVILAGIVALRGLTGWRRMLVLVPAALLAVAGVLLALFPGSGEALVDGTGEYHALGATAGFISANVLAIILGRQRERLGFSLPLARLLTISGVVGLVAMVGYFADIITDTMVFIGLIERAVIYPFLISVIIVGVSIVRRAISTRSVSA